jgi:hypothetical protein
MNTTHATTHKFPIGSAAGLLGVIVVLALLLLSDIDAFWKIGIVCILAGTIAGPLIFRTGQRKETIASEQPLDVRINSASIPVRGGIGAALVIAVLFTGAFLELPELRWLALPGLAAGLIFGAALILWRKHQG